MKIFSHLFFRVLRNEFLLVLILYINNNSTLKKLYSEQGTKLDLAIVLVNLRKDIGWSKMQLAKKLSIPRTIIEMIENGDVLPTMTFLRLLAYVT